MRVVAVALLLTALAAVVASADSTVPPPPPVVAGHPDHQKRGYMCRKGSTIMITPYTLVYMPGRKRITKVTAVPTKGRMMAWSGTSFDIPITNVDDATAYIGNVSLFGDPARKIAGRRGFFVEQRFRYFAPVVRNASGYPMEFPIAREMDWFNVSIEFVSTSGQVHQIDTEAAIDVVNAAPYIINPRYGIVNSQPRWISLAAADPDMTAVLPLREITSAWISASADSSVFPCKISLKPGGDAIDWSKTSVVNVSLDNLGVFVTPPAEFGEGSQCLFNFTVADMNQMESEMATVRVFGDSVKKPLAFSTRARLRRNDLATPIDLIGSSNNVGKSANVAFVITALPDPVKEGKVYFVLNTDSPDDSKVISIPAGATSVVAYNGTSRRLRLYFRRMTNQVMFESAVVKYYVDDGFARSDTAQVSITTNGNRVIRPVCQDTRMENVFQDRSRTVQLKYAFDGRNPNGVAQGHFDRLQLLVVPPSEEYGKLYQTLNTAAGLITRPLGVGSYFQDNATNLLFVPNINHTRVTVPVELKYKYRAMTESGLSCSAWITIVVTSHDNPSQIVDGMNIRLERARTNELTLIALRGKANASLGVLDSAIFARVTKFGKMYSVNLGALASSVSLYAGIGPTMRPFCRQYDCSKFMGDQITVGSEVKAVKDVRGGRQIFVLYAAPASLTPELAAENNRDTALYTFKGVTGETASQKLDIIVAKGRLPRLYFYFDAPQRTTNFSSSPDVRVPITINNTDYAVQVMPFSVKENRHGIAAPFRLFQLGGVEGTEYKLGERVASSTMYGINGQWVTNNNTLILVGASRGLRRMYRFRVKVYKQAAGSDTQLADDGKEYRVIVMQRATVPSWDFNITDVEVRTTVSENVEVHLGVIDDSNNVMAFRLLEAPKYGRLKAPRAQFGTVAASYLDEGMTFRLPRGTILRQWASLMYLCEGGVQWTYPLTDRFVIAADNGLGTLSKPLTIVVRVYADRTTLDNQEQQKQLPNATYALVGVFLFLGAIVSVTVFIVRKRRHQLYRAIATDPVAAANAPHPGVNS